MFTNIFCFVIVTFLGLEMYLKKKNILKYFFFYYHMFILKCLVFQYNRFVFIVLFIY